MRRIILIFFLFISCSTYGQGYALLGHKPAATGISYVTSGTGTGTLSTVSTPTLNCLGANLAVVGMSYQLSATSPSITDNQGNTYTQIRADANTTRLAWYYCLNPTFAFTSSTYFSGSTTLPYVEIWAFVYSGATGIDGTGVGNIGSGTTCQAGSTTPTHSNSYLMSMVNWLNVPAPTVNSGFTLVSSNTIGTNFYTGGAAYLFLASPSATNETWSQTGSSTNFTVDKVIAY